MLPDLSALDADALRTLILEQQEELLSRDTEIENLGLLILKLKRMQFGCKSERLDKQIHQLELRLKDLEAGQSCKKSESARQPLAAADGKPSRRPLPEHLPRKTETYAPKHTACPP